MRFAVIMAGGRGERLWPLSRKETPKQFLKLLGERTLLQQTVERVLPLVPLENTYVVVGREHVGIVREQLPKLPRQNIIVEPMGRGTAPCVGLAAMRLSRIDPEGVMIVLPADHVIADEERFRHLLDNATTIAEAGTHLITLGITPDRPATGYGYIQARLSKGDAKAPVLEVERFTEKPDRDTAQRFLDEGNYYWNSGMFIWKIDAILREMEEHMPKLHSELIAIEERAGTPNYEETLAQTYAEQEVNSIDYGVLEKSERVLVLPTGEIGWSDIGDWSALNEVLETDEEGNLIRASHIGIDTSNCTILSRHESGSKRLIATLGLSDVVIIDTDDILLVMDKSRAQEVKRIIEIQTAKRQDAKTSK
ncbi:mannose-1-phosphate guanylyltransferase [Candidatus Bipolaricaulota bacterium]|nr:mannose-1-phosphate guanylyltransferase [Candidatus Bipolaricaulota bacterium]